MFAIGDNVKYTPLRYDPYSRSDTRVGMTGIITRIRATSTDDLFTVLLTDDRTVITAEKNLTKVY